MKTIKYLYRAYRYKYLLDPCEISYISKNLNKGDIAVDIGSHKGGYLHWLQKGVGKSGMAYAFEPQIILYNYLKDMVQGSGKQNIVVENKGISSEPGFLDLYIPMNKRGTSPSARLNLQEDLDKHQKVEIEVVTLDDYFLAKGILPNLIKIDAEGHEKEVLLSGLALLKKCKPKIIMECEVRHLNGVDINDVFRILLDLDYKGYFIENEKMKPLTQFKLHLHQKLPEEKFWEEKGYVNNFIFE